jgi:two-component system sensor histidine kinase PilS (NtrC family)
VSDSGIPSLVDATTSSVLEQSDVFDAVHAPAAASDTDAGRRRRISYFMLVRLAMLAAFTVLAAALTYTSDPPLDSLYITFVWTAIGLGYAATIWFARRLRRTQHLERHAWLQTSFDIVAGAIVVEMTGGIDSGFVFLFLIAILGATIMGGPRSTWAAAGACAAIWVVTSSLQFFEIVDPLFLGNAPAPLLPLEFWTTVLRAIGAMLGVTVLSSYLNLQIASSASQVIDLRALNENIVRSLSSGLLSCAEDGRVVYFNPAAREILELRESDLGHDFGAIFPEMSPNSEAGDELPRDEVELTTRSGRRLHIGLSRTALRDGKGQRIGDLVIFQDLTQLHELTENVRRNERLAALGGMAASVAHEVRNPLAAISGSAELLGSAELGDEDARLLSIIRRESGRLSDIVTDLLAFTRPRTPQRSRTDASRVTRDACEAFSADPNNRNVEVSRHAAEAVWLEADPVQLGQVLWNLLRNAGEAMDGSGHIEVRVTHEAGEARITITDDGPGIPPGRRERIFDPFFTTKDHGTGFGLAIAHRVTEDNGGTLELDDSVKAGARFVLRFPAVRPPPAKT